MSDENIKEACGIFGICGNENAAMLTVLGLFALQHRGEEACGIVSSDKKKLHQLMGEGKVNNVFNSENTKSLVGNMAIGHTRYSVTGGSNKNNVQPLFGELYKGKIAVGHNGNITNAYDLRKQLEQSGSIFQTSMDSEIVLHLIARSVRKSLKDSIIDAVNQLKGSFCLIIQTIDCIYAIRDPKGFRPLCLGKLDDSNIVCSETSALDLINAKYMGQVNPGEMITLKDKDVLVEKIFPEKPISQCIFELVYFSRPDSLIFGESVYDFRKKLGRTLAKEAPVDADIVVPVPDSGIYAALGYSEESGIPFEMAITRNHYVGRTFIQPDQDMRESFARIKLNPIKNILYKKKVVIVDDSIVRGTTTRARVKSLRAVGVKEIHMRISCPAIKHSCYYGIDFPDKKKLIANNFSLDEIAAELNLDSLAFISLDGMKSAGSEKNQYCDACFSGNYPVEVNTKLSKDALES